MSLSDDKEEICPGGRGRGCDGAEIHHQRLNRVHSQLGRSELPDGRTHLHNRRLNNAQCQLQTSLHPRYTEVEQQPMGSHAITPD